ncbi:MAG: hypothetical protein GEU79_08805 [Acidimicrobiia bacterium]|nr:hypothetical protein [Acidimicrobiia bacterium]
MTRYLTTMSWLTVVWVALWGTVSWANVLGGMVVAVLVMTLIPPHRPGPPVGTRPLVAVRLVFYMLWKMVEASASVAWEVLSPGKVRSAIIAIPIRGASPAVVSTSCICIGLTPGTMVLKIADDPPTLYVHVLRMSSIEKSRADILHLEKLIEEALPAGVPIEDR